MPLRNKPHLVSVIRFRDRIVDGFTYRDEVVVGILPGVLSGLEPRERVELSGAVPGAEASFRVDHGADVKTGDKVRITRPVSDSLSGDWKVATVRWSPAALRLILSRGT